jgi:two-component system CheB/CheR fusion protein
LSVLLVEDRLEEAFPLATLLGVDGNRVRIAADGQTALRRVLTEQPDVILLDLGLPELDGFEVAAAVRGAHLPWRPWIIAVSGHDEPWVREQAANAGIDDFYAKPIEPAAIRALVRLLPPGREMHNSTPEQSALPEVGASILDG